MSVVTRFAPSPTGFLHIGGARTALFNWLYARRHAGAFALRIEDTDRKRSTDGAIDAIFRGLEWLELDWDGDAVFQSRNAGRHAAVAEKLLAEGKAYRCYCTAEELAQMREKAKKPGGGARIYDGRWRDRDPADAPAGAESVVRIKMPLQGDTTIRDLVQGEVTRANDTLDDFVILRSDGTPTYMLAAAVDDHDMGVTHAIRGDDHLNNAFRQHHLYRACGWDVPAFAHVPLIHGADGARLSKRHGALGVGNYRELGILPAAMRNYLLRLGWSHGNDEIIETAQAVEWFDLDSVGRSPARFDMDRLLNLNAHYLKRADIAELSAMVLEAAADPETAVSPEAESRLARGLPELVKRVKTISELVDSAGLYLTDAPMEPDDKAARILADPASRKTVSALARELAGLASWSEAELDRAAREFAQSAGLKLGQVAQPLRAALTGRTVSPGIFEVMAVLGRDETMARLAAAAD